MYAKIDIDIFSLLVLAVVMASHLRNSHDSLRRQQFFRGMILSDMAILLIHIFITMTQGRTHAEIVNLIIWSLYLTGCLMFCLMWALFFTIKRGQPVMRYEFLLLLLPLLISVVFLGVNLAGGLVFSISRDHTISRGPLFPIIIISMYAYIIYTFVLLLHQKKNMTPGEEVPYLLSPMLVMAVGIVQTLINIDIPIVWPAVAVALLVMQLRMLGEKANIDYLTGLYNRKYIDNYINDLLQSGGGMRGVRSFAALMLDIDGFKRINDNFGHVEGDRAIMTAAEILKKSVRKGDFVARYGGDEFLVILDHSSSGTPKRVIKRIRDSLARFNGNNIKPYRLEFSIGYKLFSGDADLSAKEIFSSIDELMYRNKLSKTTVKINSGQRV